MCVVGSNAFPTDYTYRSYTPCPGKSKPECFVISLTKLCRLIKVDT